MAQLRGNEPILGLNIYLERGVGSKWYRVRGVRVNKNMPRYEGPAREYHQLRPPPPPIVKGRMVGGGPISSSSHRTECMLMYR
jgi:hypothetical protein